VNAFAHLTVPEIKSGLVAVIALGGAAIALFVAVAMVRAGIRAAAGRLARLARAASRTIAARRGSELAAERPS
jgi:ABC-type sulfate transport system permease subunit